MKNKLLPFLLVSVAINLYAGMPVAFEKIREAKGVISGNSISEKSSAQAQSSPEEAQGIFDEINPVEGFSLNVTYGKIGPKMISQGVIDFQKFKDTYASSGQPLTEEQEEILLRGSDETIVITRDNAYFLLNFFWAAGLSNTSKVLTDGEIISYSGGNPPENFASTGGWTLGKSDAMSYYAKGNIIPLTEAQDELVNVVASGIYRPCCNNSTAFPDCNHGMALLGILELMAAGGATEDEMYAASKYINAYWFPGNYYDLAVYFNNKENMNFSQIDPKTLLSKEYSSASGAQSVKAWLIDEGIVAEPPKRNGGCGV